MPRIRGSGHGEGAVVMFQDEKEEHSAHLAVNGRLLRTICTCVSFVASHACTTRFKPRSIYNLSMEQHASPV
jgi:hypothetical protein